MLMYAQYYIHTHTSALEASIPKKKKKNVVGDDKKLKQLPTTEY